MTSSAMTASGRAATRTPADRKAPAPGHRRRLRGRPAPSMPRRVSGPLVRRPRTAAIPRHGGTLGMHALAVVRSLPEHSLIDRLVRGRAWIPVLGVLLAGIVAMQVEVLKLGTSMGRLVQRSTALQSQDESLQANVAWLGDDQRIERLATGMGMVMPAPTMIAFVKAASDRAARRAVANIRAPDPTTFANELAVEAASAAAASAPASATATSAPTASTTTASTTTAATPTGPATTASTTTAATTTASTTTAATTTAATTTAATVAPAGPAQPTTQSSSTGTAGAGAAPQSPATGAAAVTPTTSSQSGSPAGG